jgi:hypothetical protein
VALHQIFLSKLNVEPKLNASADDTSRRDPQDNGSAISTSE